MIAHVLYLWFQWIHVQNNSLGNYIGFCSVSSLIFLRQLIISRSYLQCCWFHGSWSDQKCVHMALWSTANIPQVKKPDMVGWINDNSSGPTLSYEFGYNEHFPLHYLLVVSRSVFMLKWKSSVSIVSSPMARSLCTGTGQGMGMGLGTIGFIVMRNCSHLHRDWEWNRSDGSTTHFLALDSVPSSTF